MSLAVMHTNKNRDKTTTINIPIIISDMYMHDDTNFIHTQVKKPAFHLISTKMIITQSQLHVVVSFTGGAHTGNETDD